MTPIRRFPADTKLPAEYWEIRVEVGEPGARAQVRRRFALERDAKDALDRIAKDKLDGLHVVPDKTMTLRKLAESWATANAPSQKASTVRHYEDALRPVLDRHGDLLAIKFTSAQLVALRDEMLSGKLRRRGRPGEPLSARSANAMLSAVSGLLAYGQHQRVLVHNVANPKSVPRAVDGRTEVDERRAGWQNEHLSKFKIATADDRLAGSWMLSAYGLRRGEVLGLKWSDIDWETSTVTIRRNRTYVAGTGGAHDVKVGTPKSKASRRSLPMPPEVMDTLTRQRAIQDAERHAGAVNPDGWITVDEAGRPLRPEVYSDTFARVIKASGLPSIVLHGVRHAVASRMASKNIPLADIAWWLGQDQASLAVILGYTHRQDSGGDAVRAALAD